MQVVIVGAGFTGIQLAKVLVNEGNNVTLIDNNIEKNIGVCMKTLKNHFGSNMDGKLAQSVVKSYIG